jgi:rod shape determining protein RodA
MADRLLDSRSPSLDHFDWRFFGLITVILSLGVLSLYSLRTVSPSGGVPLYLKQLVWIGIGGVAFRLMLAVDYHKLARLAYLLYAGALLLLALVLIVGKTSRGAQRWLAIGALIFQPSEFAKLALVLTLATYYSQRPRQGLLERVVLPGLIMSPGLMLIIKQPDLGSALSYLAVYVTMLLIVGMRSKAMGILLLCTMMGFPFAWELVWNSLHDYQRERVMTFLHPAYDMSGKGYQGLQSRIAIGSGELLGKGLYGGTQSQLKFLPEGHTDFIFAVFAEEWGFVGGVVLLGLFTGLLWSCLEIAQRAKDLLGALLASGLVAVLAFGLVINVGMTVGLFPIVGVPLPLMSYGGSSMVATLAALGLLLNIKRRRLTLFY